MIPFWVAFFAALVCWPMALLAARWYVRYDATGEGFHLLGWWIVMTLMLLVASTAHFLVQPLTEYMR